MPLHLHKAETGFPSTSGSMELFSFFVNEEMRFQKNEVIINTFNP